MSSFSTLNTALSGLQAHKRVIDVIGHNISNVNTEGYSRRQVLLEPASGMKIASPGFVTAQGRCAMPSFDPMHAMTCFDGSTVTPNGR